MAKKFDFKKVGIKAAGLGVGAVVGGTLVPKVLPNLNGKIRSGATIVLGAALPAFVKNELVGHVGDGMIAIGVAKLVGELVPSLAVSGLEDQQGVSGDYVTDNGYASEYTENVNGLENQQGVAGDPDEENY